MVRVTQDTPMSLVPPTRPHCPPAGWEGGWLPSLLVQPRDMDGDTPQRLGCCGMRTWNVVSRNGDTRCPSEETPGISEKIHKQGLEVSWRRAMDGDTGHSSKGLWTSQRRVTAGDRGDPGEGLRSRDIQEGLWLRTTVILQKGHGWGPRGSWRSIRMRTLGITESVGVGDCRNPGPGEDLDRRRVIAEDPRHPGEGPLWGTWVSWRRTMMRTPGIPDKDRDGEPRHLKGSR